MFHIRVLCLRRRSARSHKVLIYCSFHQLHSIKQLCLQFMYVCAREPATLIVESACCERTLLLGIKMLRNPSLSQRFAYFSTSSSAIQIKLTIMKSIFIICDICDLFSNGKLVFTFLMNLFLKLDCIYLFSSLCQNEISILF